MANINNPKGLKPAYSNNVQAKRYVLAASITASEGDTLYLGADGLPVSLSAGHTGGYPILGAMAGPIYDKDDHSVKATSAAGDFVDVYDDVNTEFEAQIASGAATDIVTTSTSAACFDLAGTTGVEYVNQAASTYDDIRVVGVANEPATGELSAVGAYRKIIVKYNPAKHFSTRVS